MKKEIENKNEIKNEIKIEAREELRQWAVKYTSCDIQRGEGDKKDYPCGTCFCNLLENLIDIKSPQYNEHNEPVDRINEVWRFLLQLRDEKY